MYTGPEHTNYDAAYPITTTRDTQLEQDRKELARGLKEIVTALGPNAPDCCECDGCEYEINLALEIARTVLDKTGFAATV